MDTKILAKAMLEKGFLNKETYSLQDLFRIKDCLNILKGYNLADLDLLEEVEKFLKQKVEG